MRIPQAGEAEVRRPDQMRRQVDIGERVARGQVITRVGSTGDASRSQLHFELRTGRTPIDPQTVLVRDSTAVASTD